MTTFWTTLVLFIFYLFHIVERSHIMPWLMLVSVRPLWSIQHSAVQIYSNILLCPFQEFGYCAIFSFFYFVAALVMVTCGYCYGVAEAWGAAAVSNGVFLLSRTYNLLIWSCVLSLQFFAFVNMFLFGGDAFLKFRGWRSGQIAQGERTVTTSQATSPDVPPPNYPAY